MRISEIGNWLFGRQTPPVTRQELKSQILEALLLPSDREKGADFNHILGALHLGNSRACIECTHLQLRDDRNFKRPLETHSNRHEFKVVISMCPTRDLFGDCLDLMDKDLTQALHPVEWVHVGRSLLDDPAVWFPFIHDCTYPETVKELPSTLEEYESANQAKELKIKSIPVKDWFIPIFNQLDQAVFQNHKTLVHCRAGISRSATLIAAYLIYRFDLTTEQAIDFLKVRRACVAPKFREGLQFYEQSLKAFLLLR